MLKKCCLVNQTIFYFLIFFCVWRSYRSFHRTPDLYSIWEGVLYLHMQYGAFIQNVPDKIRQNQLYLLHFYCFCTYQSYLVDVHNYCFNRILWGEFQRLNALRVHHSPIFMHRLKGFTGQFNDSVYLLQEHQVPYMLMR